MVASWVGFKIISHQSGLGGHEESQAGVLAIIWWSQSGVGHQIREVSGASILDPGLSVILYHTDFGPRAFCNLPLGLPGDPTQPTWGPDSTLREDKLLCVQLKINMKTWGWAQSKGSQLGNCWSNRFWWGLNLSAQVDGFPSQ